MASLETPTPQEGLEKPKRVMHPNSLEALRIGREKAFAKRAALNLGEKKALAKDIKTIEKAETIKKKVEEIKQLRCKVEDALASSRGAPEGIKQDAKPAGVKSVAKPPTKEIASDSEDCPEAVDWKTFYKSKYKAKMAAQKEPEYAMLARDKLRQQATAHAKMRAWESMFPGVSFPQS